MNYKLFFKIPLFLVAIILSSLSYAVTAWAETAWIDVRSLDEHTRDNIEGDTRITHEDIVQGINTLFPDKETDIHLYCRSGGRAGKAMSALIEDGYTNVSNAGGIDDARKARGLIPGSTK